MRRQASGVKNGARLDEFEPSLPADGRRFADRINGQAEHGTRTMPMTPPTALMGLLEALRGIVWVMWGHVESAGSTGGT